jgi:hypothetical protein
MFVADGNFKADHIRQKNKSEVWLSEGGGIMSKVVDYERFLESAVERRTVSVICCFSMQITCIKGYRFS